MDRSLAKEREAFKKRALATPTVENKIRKADGSGKGESRAGATGGGSSGSSSSKMKAPEINYKSLTSANSSQYKFGVLARIVRHMRSRHQEGEIHALTLQEILDETNQLNVGNKIKQWLLLDALPNNPKVCEAEGGGGWVFNPALGVRDRKGLLKHLRINDMKGLGGTLMEDIVESVPQAAKIMKSLAKEVVIITRQTDKKQIVFYNDRSVEFEVDEEFKQMWRNVPVEGLHDDNIEEYLSKQGIKSMEDNSKAFIPARRKAKARRNQPTRITDNDHMAHVLKSYDLP